MLAIQLDDTVWQKRYYTTALSGLLQFSYRKSCSFYLRMMPLANKDNLPKQTLLIVMKTVDFLKNTHNKLFRVWIYCNQVTLISTMDKRMLHTGSFHTGITLTTMLIMEIS